MLTNIIKNIDNIDLHATIENVLSMREMGNKLHGDSFEIGLTELIKVRSKYHSYHVGKQFFRSGVSYDIVISNDINELDEFIYLMERKRKLKSMKASYVKIIALDYGLTYTNKKDTICTILTKIDYELSQLPQIIKVSLKCYGVGPLQLSTNSSGSLINECLKYIDNKHVAQNLPLSILKSNAFSELINDRILVVIYDENDENNLNYSIIYIDGFISLFNKVANIKYQPRIKAVKGSRIQYEIVKFYDVNDDYLFEVRYGTKNANALQRGLWTKTYKTEKIPSFEYVVYKTPYKVNYDYIQRFKTNLISHN